ncbi:MAG TPA: translation initiation factor IF-1 [Candidatus Paceibacterota bacterium]|jgi:translation initiation factor IF-1|nr:translation initiation factor IF-1 [Candidatus Paceibacterota bacterium]HRZ29955.1 translation initiation factor IF-1 [Candidatus Paceibacterota bacterium]
METQKTNDNNIIRLDGVVIESLPSATFKVEVDDGRVILAYLSGKMRMNFIKILVGDKVAIEMTPYDDKKGRIVYRY